MDVVGGFHLADGSSAKALTPYSSAPPLATSPGRMITFSQVRPPAKAIRPGPTASTSMPRRIGTARQTEARSILGVPADASQDEIKEAYARLMRMAHPDKGGTSGLAAQLNAARDRLLKK